MEFIALPTEIISVIVSKYVVSDEHDVITLKILRFVTKSMKEIVYKCVAASCTIRPDYDCWWFDKPTGKLMCDRTFIDSRIGIADLINIIELKIMVLIEFGLFNFFVDIDPYVPNVRPIVNDLSIRDYDLIGMAAIETGEIGIHDLVTESRWLTTDKAYTRITKKWNEKSQCSKLLSKKFMVDLYNRRNGNPVEQLLIKRAFLDGLCHYAEKKTIDCQETYDWLLMKFPEL
jgi:hypothetical protein